MSYADSQSDMTPLPPVSAQISGSDVAPSPVTTSPAAPGIAAPQSTVSQSPARKPGGQAGNENAAKRRFRATVPRLPREAKGRNDAIDQLRGLARSLVGGKATPAQELLIAAACRQEVLVQLAMHWLCDPKLTIDQRLSTAATMARAEEARVRILSKLGLKPDAEPEPANDFAELTALLDAGGAAGASDDGRAAP